MDGYAVISADLRSASPTKPTILRVIEAIGPGARSKRQLRSGEAVQVATGAILPPGTDAVVPVENVEVRTGEVRMGIPVRPGEHVYQGGRDIRTGELLLSKGHRIRAQDVGILVSLGFRSIRVMRRARVAVLATGNELTRANRPKKGKTAESHSPIFLRLADVLGCVAIDRGIAPDDSKKLRTALKSALAGADFVITLGGTSAGKHDFVIDAVSSLGPDALIHGLRLDRGRVTGMASVNGKPILMLPGPIQAAANAFLIAGVPIIERLSGSTGTGLSIPCVLAASWEARKMFPNFQKVVYVKLRAGRQALAEPIAGETESMKLLVEADGYFVVPERIKRLEAGNRVEVMLVPGFSFV
jgi:molybdenum cofactor synthesis domain-containing protein